MSRLVLLVVIIAAVVAQAGAVDLRSSRSVVVPEKTAVKDDLLAAGNNVDMSGNVAGTALVAGETVNVAGLVTGFLGAAGQNVNVRGVKQMVAAAGQNVNVQGLSARNVIIAGNSVNVDDTSNISRDMLLAGTNVTTRGTIGRNLKATGTNLSIGGNIRGDVLASGNNISIMPGTVIGGNFIYESRSKANIGEGARITGKIEQRIPRKAAAPKGPGKVTRAIFGFLTMFVFGVVMVALFPRWSAETALRVISAPGWSALAGFIALIITPIAAVIVFITLIGIPIGLTLLFIYIIALMVAVIVAALAVGALTLRGRTIWLQLLLGLFIIYILGAIPVLGGLVRLAVIIFGLGAIALMFFRRRAETVNA
ncbi:MAG: hypothetical protein ABFD46_07635 [Armatimonadota bacterium]